MEMIGWLVAFVIFVGIEINTMALTTIWFAGGALIAFFTALVGFSVRVQLVTFLAASFMLLFFTRPFAAKFINKGTVKTNTDSLIGRKARVTVKINNNLSSGAAVLNGQEWTVRADGDQNKIAAGSLAKVVDIKGVRLIVEKYEDG